MLEDVHDLYYSAMTIVTFELFIFVVKMLLCHHSPYLFPDRVILIFFLHRQGERREDDSPYCLLKINEENKNNKLMTLTTNKLTNGWIKIRIEVE